MAISERLALLVTLDAQGAVKSFNDLGKAADKNLSKADQRLDRMASRFQKAGAGMLASAGLLGAGLYKAGQSAADLEQAVGGTTAVFGEASGAIDEYAKKAAQAAGLSERAFREATTSIGGQLKGVGFDTRDAADEAVRLTQVAADLAATYGGTTADAVAALGSAFRGEADPAERFNLRLNQTTVNAKAVELGLAASTSQVSAQAKAQATLALITEQSADAQGQFAREGDTAAGAMARFKAESENLLASLGGAVAPVMADIADRVGGMVEGFNNLSPATQGAISKFGVLSTGTLAAAGALSFGVGKVIDMRENLSVLTDKLKTAEGGYNKFGKALGGVALVGTVAALASIGSEMSKTTTDVDKLAAALGNLSKESEQQVRDYLTFAAATGDLDTVFQQVASSNLVAAERLLAYAEANGVAADKVKELQEIIDGERRTAAQSAADNETNAASIDAAAAAIESYGGASQTAAGKADGLTTAVDEQKEALDLATESANLFKEGIDAAFGDLSLEEAVDRRASAFSDMAREFADAQQNVQDAKQRVRDLLAIKKEDRTDTFARDLAAAQAEVQEALGETTRRLDGNSEAALRNRENIRGAVDDIAAVIQAHRDEGASLDELRYIRGLEIQNLESQLEQMGFNREEISRYVEAIDAIPITKATTLTVETAAAEAKLKAALDRMQQQIDLNPLSIDVAQSEKFVNRAAQEDLRSRRAIGGPVTAGQGYSVNEYLGAGQGYEWFAPANGTVMSAGSGSGGASIDQTVNIYNPAPETPSQSARSLRRVALEVAG